MLREQLSGGSDKPNSPINAEFEDHKLQEGLGRQSLHGCRPTGPTTGS